MTSGEEAAVEAALLQAAEVQLCPCRLLGPVCPRLTQQEYTIKEQHQLRMQAAPAPAAKTLPAAYA